MSKPLYKTKTFWTGITALIGAVGGVVTGALPLVAGIQLGVTALLGIFLRDGIRTN
jgi:hypothetical protein